MGAEDGALDEGEAARVMRLAARLGDEMLAAGAETRTVVMALDVVARRFGMPGLTIDLAARCIHLQNAVERDRPLVMLQPTQSGDDKDLVRMSLLHRLVTDIATERIGVAEAEDRIDRIDEDARRWPWWVRVAGSALLAAMISLQAGGTAVGAVLAAAVLVLVDRSGAALRRGGLPGFYITMFQAALVVVSGLVCYLLGGSGRTVAGLMTANLVLMLPILSVVSLVEDAVAGFDSIAASRMVGVIMAIGALVAGVAIAGGLILTGTAFEQVAYGVKFASLPLLLGLLAAAVGAAGNTLANGGAVRLVPAGVAAGLLAAAVNNVARDVLGQSAPLSVLLAAVVLGAVATWAGTRLLVPSTALVIPGVTGALLPGPDVYIGLVRYASGVGGAGHALGGALITTAAIGVGVVLGNFAGSRRILKGAPDVPW
ncbi:threonine/serine exporter family protein [Actinomadura macrotermitis]|uniref:Threonine/serine exporter-like N-terminal domain-containing protein n=1 Tax=Actinomadura macrotermitis TaxID=2585200 RepID=A0A7K0BQ40_9ACTN|nr:threonine/serine exporter family protein [Actinomadura macrotermitis]MQY03283.1 hypothetical protein [Actinomadura macrotermitis]